jgi:hypothetical protein
MAVPIRSNSESTLMDAKNIADKLSASHYSREAAQFRRNVPSDVYRMVRTLRKFDAKPKEHMTEKTSSAGKQDNVKKQSKYKGGSSRDQQNVYRAANRESFVYPPSTIHLSTSCGQLDNTCQRDPPHRGLRCVICASFSLLYAAGALWPQDFCDKIFLACLRVGPQSVLRLRQGSHRHVTSVNSCTRKRNYHN